MRAVTSNVELRRVRSVPEEVDFRVTDGEVAGAGAEPDGTGIRGRADVDCPFIVVNEGVGAQLEVRGNQGDGVVIVRGQDLRRAAGGCRLQGARIIGVTVGIEGNRVIGRLDGDPRGAGGEGNAIGGGDLDLARSARGHILVNRDAAIIIGDLHAAVCCIHTAEANGGDRERVRLLNKDSAGRIRPGGEVLNLGLDRGGLCADARLGLEIQRAGRGLDGHVAGTGDRAVCRIERNGAGTVAIRVIRIHRAHHVCLKDDVSGGCRNRSTRIRARDDRGAVAAVIQVCEVQSLGIGHIDAAGGGVFCIQIGYLDLDRVAAGTNAVRRAENQVDLLNIPVAARIAVNDASTGRDRDRVASSSRDGSINDEIPTYLELQVYIHRPNSLKSRDG